MTFLQDYGFFTFFVNNLLWRFANQSNSLNKSSLLEIGILIWIFITIYKQLPVDFVDTTWLFIDIVLYSKGKIPKKMKWNENHKTTYSHIHKITTLQSYNLEV